MGKEIFKNNLKAMEKWYPAFADMIREAEYKQDDVEIRVLESLDGEKIFRVKKEDRLLYLNGRRNAGKPIEMWLERIGEIHDYAPVFLFGIGSALYLKAMIQNTEENVNVIVYEPSINIFLKTLEEIELWEEIENRPIAFIVEGINEDEYEAVMEKVLSVQNMEFLKEEIHPNYRELYGEKIVEKIKRLHRKVQAPLVNYRTGMLFQRNIVENIFHNIRYVCDGYHTKKLSEVIPYDGAAILVAAGPSLNKNIKELKRAKNRVFIAAVDTALKPLIKEGIMPDIFITIDPKKPLDLFDIEGAEQLPMVAPVDANYKALEQHKGKKIFFDDGTLIARNIFQMNGKTFLNVATGGSVACNGFSLLYKMGFETVILVGQDLAYTDNKSHADGTFQDKMPKMDTENMIMVKGNYQDKVPTLQNLQLYLEWFEDYIEGAKKNGSFRVVNATEGGAYIEGTELMSLSDILDEVCGEEIKFSEKIEQMESDFSETERKKAVEYLHTIPDDFSEIQKNARELKKLYQNLERMSRSGNIHQEKLRRLLKKIKKCNNRCEEKDVYQMVVTMIPVAEYIVLSEYYYEGDSVEEDLQTTAQKGVRFSNLLGESAALLKGMSEDLLLAIK